MIKRFKSQNKIYSKQSMSMRKMSKNSDLLKFDSYNSIRDQLEAENQLLMQERQQLQRGFQSNPNMQSYNTIIQHSAGLSDEYQSSAHPSPAKKSVKGKPDRIRLKINQIISLCSAQIKESKGRAPEQLKEVMEAQQQILRHLDNIKQNSKTLSASRKQLRPRSSATIGGSKRKIFQSNQKAKMDPEFQQQWQKRKSGIREAFKSEGFENVISDSIMEMIEQIERKALIEIERLRNDKISLMKKINNEIKDNNAEKRARIILEKQNYFLKKQLQKVSLRGATFGPNFNHPLEQVQQQQQQTDRAVRSRNKQSQQQITSEQQIGYGDDGNQIIYHHQYLPQQSKPNLPNPPYSHQQNSVSDRKRILKQPRTNGNSRFMSPQPHTQPFGWHQSQNEEPTSIIPSDQRIQYEINRLQHQNKMIKSTLVKSQHNNQNTHLKEKLRSEMFSLRSEIEKYQKILQQKSNFQRKVEGSHIDSLFVEGQNLHHQGQKLMRVKSKPELRHTTNITQSRREEFMREINFLKNRINTLKQENEAMISQQQKKEQSGKKSSYSSYRNPSQGKVLFDPNPSRFYSPTGSLNSRNPPNSKTVFSANKYENLISEMKKATKY